MSTVPDKLIRVVVIALAALAMVATLPGRTHGLGMVTERILNDPTFGITRVQYSDMNLWATLLGGLFCLPCGRLIDRLGLRLVLLITLAGLAASVFWMTWLGDPISLFIAILLTRGFGQSALSIVSITMVGKWFPGRISMPMAIYSLLLSAGFAGAAQLAEPWKDSDWRVLWEGIGYSLAGLFVLSALLMRDPPERQEVEESSENAIGFTLSQALRTPAFWLFGTSISLIALIGSGMSLFNESVLKEQGFPNDVYYELMKLTFLIGLAWKLPIGWLGRHISLNMLQAFGLAILGGCLLWLPMIRTHNMIRLYAVVMGLSGTTTTVLFFTVWAQAYGRKHLGQIQSVAQMLTVLASALGPKFFAETFARTGSYTLIFQSMAMIVLGLAGISLFVRVPSPDEADAPQPADGLATAPALEG